MAATSGAVPPRAHSFFIDSACLEPSTCAIPIRKCGRTC